MHAARLGILGGTFNPPHLGHLALARHALQELGLERVVLMPACRSPHKPPVQEPGPERRLRMCRLAIEDAPGLGVCAMEVERGGQSYTVDTLRALAAAHPDARPTLIVGADVARTLPSWREPAELMALADLAVALRAGTGPGAVRDALDPLLAGGPPSEARLRFLEMPVVDISSSSVRDRVRRGEPIEELVGPAVASYIAGQRLYREPVEVGAR